jgi:hypothetical protein
MEVTSLISQLDELRSKHKEPISYIELARHSIKEQLARSVGIEMPPILSEAQRLVFLQNIDHLAAFLESENGADAVELLMDAFARFTEQAHATPPDDECDEVVEVDEVDELEDEEDEK